MLNHYSNQAAGLLGLRSQPGPRLIAVVAHGDEQAELPLLWQLCIALVSLGYSVTVLDATTDESDSNPGLDQILDATHWRDEDHEDTAAWTVLPAGKGVQTLCAIHAPGYKNLRQLGHLFPQDGVLILYSKVEWMITLMGNCGAAPLLAVSPAKTSLLTSYLALKRLLMSGGLKPTIVNMVPDLQYARTRAPLSPSTSLSECARKFLGHEMKTLTIVEQNGEDVINGDIQGLVLRLLECGVAVGVDDFPIATDAHVTHFGHVDQFAGSH